MAKKREFDQYVSIWQISNDVFSEKKNKAPNDTCSVTLAYVTKNDKTVTYFL